MNNRRLIAALVTAAVLAGLLTVPAACIVIQNGRGNETSGHDVDTAPRTSIGAPQPRAP